jgi:hypothetical protein
MARRERIRNIRRRITIGAGMLVAVFSGLVLYRSIDQQTTSATPTASVTRESDDSTLFNQVVSVFADDDHEEDGDDDEESDDDGSIFSIFTPSSDPAPVTSSQS